MSLKVGQQMTQAVQRLMTGKNTWRERMDYYPDTEAQESFTTEQAIVWQELKEWEAKRLVGRYVYEWLNEGVYGEVGIALDHALIETPSTLEEIYDKMIHLDMIDTDALSKAWRESVPWKAEKMFGDESPEKYEFEYQGSMAEMEEVIEGKDYNYMLSELNHRGNYDLISNALQASHKERS